MKVCCVEAETLSFHCTTQVLPCVHFFSLSIKLKVQSLSRVRLFVTLWTVAYQAPLSTAFSRQEYWSGVPFPSPEDLPDPGIEPRSPTLWADALSSEPPGKSFIVYKVSLYVSFNSWNVL